MTLSNIASRLCSLSFVATITLATLASRAPAVTSIQDQFAAANAAFDSAVAAMPHDPQTSKAALSRTASLYEDIARQTNLSDSARARVLFNAGLAHQLAGQAGPAVLAYRRAELLTPNTPGLAANLAQARQGVSGTTPMNAPTPTPPTAPGETAPSSTSSHDSPSAAPAPLDLAKSFIGSIPRPWLWRTAIAAFVGFWTLLLCRLLIPRSSWRPHAVLIIFAALASILPASALWHRQTLLNDHHDAVLMLETTPRTGPDELTFPPSSTTPARAGTELVTLESRDGSDGRAWVRVRPRLADASGQSFWLPRSAVEPVLPIPGLPR